MRPATRQPSRGFTVIEAMIVVAIVATLCAISLPSLASLTASTRARTGNNDLMTSIQFTRATAAARQNEIVLCPSRDQSHCDKSTWWQHGWIVFQDLDHDGTRDANEPVVFASQAQSGIAIATSAGREHVTYRGDGTSPGTNLTFTLCDRRGPKHASTIVISNSGRPRLGTPTPAEAATACAGVE